MRYECVITSQEDKRRIADEFKVKAAIVSKAMHFRSDSLLARKARCYAVNHLGCTVYVHPRHLIKAPSEGK